MPVAVVTGSSSGIGRAIALRFAREGYSVLLHARRSLANLQDVARKAQQAGAETRAATADIRCPAACQDFVRAAFGWRGQVDVWVNNAGADVLTGSLATASFEQRLQALLAVDVAGTIRLSRAAADRMRATASSPPSVLINISWDQAELGMEGEAGELFCPAKAAVAAFTRSLALSHPELRVNAVAPGWIKTAWGEAGPGDYWDRRAREESLSGRWGTPEDVAEAVFWLASGQARFVNGQTLALNGGRRYYPR